jgi:hypothetical protein
MRSYLEKSTFHISATSSEWASLSLEDSDVLESRAEFSSRVDTHGPKLNPSQNRVFAHDSGSELSSSSSYSQPNPSGISRIRKREDQPPRKTKAELNREKWERAMGDLKRRRPPQEQSLSDEELDSDAYIQPMTKRIRLSYDKSPKTLHKAPKNPNSYPPYRNAGSR